MELATIKAIVLLIIICLFFTVVHIMNTILGVDVTSAILIGTAVFLFLRKRPRA